MKKGILISIFILLILILIMSGIIINIKSNTNTKEQNDKTVEGKNNIDVEEVKSATAYFTVQSCINNYITYLTNKDVDSILKILDYQYIEDNNITRNNVLEKVEKISGEIIFEADKMYVQELDSNNQVYYVHGILKEEELEAINTIDDNFCITVNMDFSNNIFSIVPFGNGGLFNEESN